MVRRQREDHPGHVPQPPQSDQVKSTNNQQGEEALTTITSPPADPAPKKSFIRKAWPWAAVAIGGLILGSAIGSAGGADATTAAPRPAPTVTITAEPEVTQSASDGLCREVAGKLFEMLGKSINDIAIPQNEVVLILVDNMTGIPRISEIERATGKLEGATRATESITAELADVSDDYMKCME